MIFSYFPITFNSKIKSKSGELYLTNTAYANRDTSNEMQLERLNKRRLHNMIIGVCCGGTSGYFTNKYPVVAWSLLIFIGLHVVSTDIDNDKQNRISSLGTVSLKK